MDRERKMQAEMEMGLHNIQTEFPGAATGQSREGMNSRGLRSY